MNAITPRTEIGTLDCQWCGHEMPVKVGAQKGNRLVATCPNCGSRATAGAKADQEMKAEYLASIESTNDDDEEITTEIEDAAEASGEEDNNSEAEGKEAEQGTIDGTDDGGHTGTDAGSDAGADARTDARTDAGADTGTGSGADTAERARAERKPWEFG